MACWLWWLGTVALAKNGCLRGVALRGNEAELSLELVKSNHEAA